MTKEELKQEAEEWLNKWELCNKCDHKVQCIENNAMCPQVVERAYLASAEPREKRIAELEEKIKSLEGNSSLREGILWNDIHNQDKKIAELEKENAELKQKYDTCLRENTGLKIHSAYVEKKLTKAKELLERLLITSCNSDVLNLLPNCSEVLRVRVEAEQFLKDLEK